jgi:proteasome lid subunit RPN8/RPN11
LTVLLPSHLEQEIREHGARAYNEEACGVLLGSEDRSQGDGPDQLVVQVAKIRPMENTKQEERERRYLIDPLVMMRIEQELDESPWDLIGIYHSHPDHPARPSQFDQDHALPGLSYLILAVSEGAPADLTSWRLSDDRTTFHPEGVKIINHQQPSPS